jgi:hypothetical protein
MRTVDTTPRSGVCTRAGDRAETYTHCCSNKMGANHVCLPVR